MLVAAVLATTPSSLIAQGTVAAGHGFLGRGFAAFITLPMAGTVALAAVLLFMSWRHFLAALAVCASLATLPALIGRVSASDMKTMVVLGGYVLFPMTCFIVFGVATLRAYRRKRAHAKARTPAATRPDHQGAAPRGGASGAALRTARVNFPRAALVLPPVLLVAFNMVLTSSNDLAARALQGKTFAPTLLYASWPMAYLGGLVIDAWAVIKGLRLLRSGAARATVANVACLAVGVLFLLLSGAAILLVLVVLLRA